MTGKMYARYAEGRAAKSPLFRDCLTAWAIGGAICSCGEALRRIWLSVTKDPESAGLMVSVSLILLTAVLTGFGVYDKLARHAGGGTLVYPGAPRFGSCMRPVSRGPERAERSFFSCADRHTEL